MSSVVGSVGEPEEVVDLVRRAIHEGDFVPNQRLVEGDLSVQFGASRAAVRTALVQLAAEGLVERVQNRGARVRAVSLDEAIEISEVRMVVEGLCAAKAAARASEEDLAIRCAASPPTCSAAVERRRPARLLRAEPAAARARSGSLGDQATADAMLERLRGQNVRHQFRLALHPGRAAVSLPQHLEIVDAICAGDPDAAEAAMRAHLRQRHRDAPAGRARARPAPEPLSGPAIRGLDRRPDC